MTKSRTFKLVWTTEGCDNKNHSDLINRLFNTGIQAFVEIEKLHKEIKKLKLERLDLKIKLGLKQSKEGKVSSRGKFNVKSKGKRKGQKAL